MPFDIRPAAPPGLANDAYLRLAAFFVEADHHPSPEQRAAIRDLLDHLQRAADGKLEDAVYLSSIPAGTGKTTSLVAFSQALVNDATYADTGILITVNRIDEARDIAMQMADVADKVCVFTSDPKVNALGQHSDANAAQVCISTQAALKLTLKALAGRPFGDASRYHYRGRRRAVVCWDEFLGFNRPVTLDADAVVSLSGAMRRQSSDAANSLMEWAAVLAKAGEGVHAVPDFTDLGVDFRRLEDDVADRDDLVAQVRGLAIMSGGQGYATQGDYGKPTLIAHYPELPPSLMPVIVTDASARLNRSYALMAQKVPVRWLREATKTYRNMTLRIVPAAASRSVYRDPKSFRGRDLIDMATRYIRSVAPEEVLVVSYKGNLNIHGVTERTIRAAIDARLGDGAVWIDKGTDLRRVHHITWGQHTASNDFKHVRHIILMGLNFLPRPASYASAGAALDMDLTKERPDATDVEDMRLGMLKDATLQAILRGNARMGVDGDCGFMEVVIPQTKQTGLSANDYVAMFPGVSIEDDRVLIPPKPLKGRLRQLQRIVDRRILAGETELSNPSLYAEMAMRQPNFAKLVRNPEWQAYCAAAGLRPMRLKGSLMGLRKVA